MPFVPKWLLGIIPFHRIVNKGWVTGNEFIGENQNFTTQWVECSYPVSGTYATTPRFIYYIFLLGGFMPDCLIACLEYIEYRTANKKRVWLENLKWLKNPIRIDWLQETALGLAMAYSSTTAIHAIIMAASWKTAAPDELFDKSKHEIVQVEGNWTGTYETSTNLTYSHNNVTLPNGTAVFNDHLWMPLLPMVRDHDADPVLSVVGSAFLLFLPLNFWSRKIREKKFKIVRYYWGILIAALIYENFAVFSNMWQLRFCPAEQQDKLPIVNRLDNYSDFAGPWHPGTRGARYRWNKVVVNLLCSTTPHYSFRTIAYARASA